MMRYSIKPIARKYIKGYGCLSFARNLCNKYRKQLLDTATKTASRKVIHKAAETTGEVLPNKIDDAVAKSYDDEIIKNKICN